MKTPLETLTSRIEGRKASCAVIGLGYVGLPLAVELARAGFRVHGIDLDPGKIRAINAGRSYIPDVPTAELRRQVRAGRLIAGSDYSVVRRCDTVNICVPTPLSKTRDPDISYIVNSVEGVRPHVHPGMLVILESTTYPGTTDEVVTPALADARLRVGKEIFVAFSPERVDPGNAVFNTRNIPKVVGGTTAACTRVAVAFYRSFLDKVHPVSGTRAAEMIKIHENTFRSVNIGLVNELALICDRMGIDVWEVIDGASTKPFGFMPFYPGPGLGGHCIPVDPYYLAWKARSVGFEARFIELAGHVNAHMPDHVVAKAVEALNRAGKPLKGSRVLILGVAYKKNIDDLRESPALDIILKLGEKGARVSYCDPFIPWIEVDGRRLASRPPSPSVISSADLVVIVTDHDSFDYAQVLRSSRLILDTRNALKGRGGRKVSRI
jgi:UDP-N-acetyl-D-glucosamine dehydrogenase